MKIASTYFRHVIEIEEGGIASLVVENPKLLRDIVTSLRRGCEGDDDSIVVSHEGKTLDISTAIEVVDTFAPLSLNSKTLSSALVKRLDKVALGEGWRSRTMLMLDEIRRYVAELTMEAPHEIVCEGISVLNLLKSAGLSFEEESYAPGDLLLAYMRLVREFVGDRLFVLVGSRMYYAANELTAVTNICALEKIMVMFLDGMEFPLLPNENRLVVDNDFCELTSQDDVI